MTSKNFLPLFGSFPYPLSASIPVEMPLNSISNHLRWSSLSPVLPKSSQKGLIHSYVLKCCANFSSATFRVSGLMLRFWSIWTWVLCKGRRWGSSSALPHENSPNIICLKDYAFATVYFQYLCKKLVGQTYSWFLWSIPLNFIYGFEKYKVQMTNGPKYVHYH